MLFFNFGYGNSQGTGWNSYEEVEIYGDSNCASLSVLDRRLESTTLTIYLNPASRNFINLETTNQAIGAATLYDLKGIILSPAK